MQHQANKIRLFNRKAGHRLGRTLRKTAQTYPHQNVSEGKNIGWGQGNHELVDHQEHDYD